MVEHGSVHAAVATAQQLLPVPISWVGPRARGKSMLGRER